MVVLSMVRSKEPKSYEKMRTAGARGRLVDACTKHGDIKVAREIFVSVAPDGAPFNSLIDGCAGHGEFERTEEIYETPIFVSMVPDGARSSRRLAWFRTFRTL